MKKYLYIIIVLVITTSCGKKAEYIKSSGYIFGTTYHIKYQSKKNYDKQIIAELNKYNHSLSMFEPTSIIGKINSNDTTVVLDNYFIKCFKKAQEVSNITDGAFDITVAPIVDAWGFGINNSANTDANIDSIMQFVGYKHIHLVQNKIIKEHKETMLDMSAIAKGYGVDIVSEFFNKKRVKNYMVEIGGEVRVRGLNPKGVNWTIGIDKPIDDVLALHREFQDIISITNKSIATSGNYRQFYEKDGIKYSHTINPKTGYPARNGLLSASVLTNDCMTADAFATAFMVMGTQKSIELAEKLDNIDIYLIYTDSLNNYKIYKSNGFKNAIIKK